MRASPVAIPGPVYIAVDHFTVVIDLLFSEATPASDGSRRV